jgi:pyruvate/2-oxoglutarate dehydrogenase complex dihydrolipoamide dehydrogenase (E3) component
MTGMEPLRADICIIGAGSAGLSVAAGAAQLGRRVILVEKERMGGDCLNTGCIPSKALIAAARAAHAVRGAAAFGIQVPEPAIDGVRVHVSVKEAIAAIAPHDSVERFAKLGVLVIRAAARFQDAQSIVAGDQLIKARRFVVATGSRAAIPPIPGLDKVSFFTNETIFEKDFIPDHLMIIGGGPVGVELAQAHRRLGAQVTLIEAQRLLSREDRELAGYLRDGLAKEGIRILEGTQATSIVATENGARLQLVTPHDSEILEGRHLLVAVGRKPNIEDLELEKAGIAADAHGIRVDHRLMTSNPRVYAIGDVTGAPQFTHVAGYHASLVIRHALFRLPVRCDYAAVPRVTFSDPEFAHVGQTEEEARAARNDVRVAYADVAENDRAVTDRETFGRVKIVAGGGGRVLGASILAPHAGELILPWVMAVKARMRLSAMAGLVAPYPTLSESSKRAAGAYYTPALFSRRTRLLVRFLSWL